MSRPVTIAGGGLAGLSLAIGLRRRGVPVHILEAGSYPRHRVCGEFISGVSAATLEHLGIAGLLEDAGRQATFTWQDRGRLLCEGRFAEPALCLSRHLLDQRLFLLAGQLGCEVATRTRAKPEPAEGLVWAAGRRPQPGRFLGLKAHLKGLPSRAGLEMHLGANGYLGICSVEEGWANVCGLFRVDRALEAKGPELLPAYLEAGGNHRLAAAVRNAEWRPRSFAAVAGFGLGRQPETPGLLCLGDAHSMIPPFTGNGMSMAFQSAEIALDPLLAWSSGRLPWQAAVDSVRSSLHLAFRRRLRASQLLHRALLAPGGRSLLRALATRRLLPVRPLLSLIR